jgi:hypothetical protein
MTGEWRRLHTDELCDLYSSPNTIRVIKTKIMRRSGHVTRMQERRGAYRVLVEKPEGGGTPGRPSCRLEDNIKTNLQKVGLRAYNSLIWPSTGTGSGFLWMR